MAYSWMVFNRRLLHSDDVLYDGVGLDAELFCEVFNREIYFRNGCYAGKNGI